MDLSKKRAIVAALLKKTTANGCTPEEARTARAKAEEIAAKYGVPLTDAPPRDDWDAAVRRAAERAAARAREAAEAAERERLSKLSVEELVWTLLLANRKREKPLSNDKIAAVARKLKPGTKTSADSVAWYKSQFKKRGWL